MRLRAYPRLPFPTVPLQINDVIVEEYIIPPAMKRQVLEQVYPFRPIPSLDAEYYDLHSERRFRVHQFRVTREDGFNCLVSPYYEDGGGTVIDWVPADEIED